MQLGIAIRARSIIREVSARRDVGGHIWAGGDVETGGNDDGNSIGEGVGGEGEEDWECEKVGGEHAESS